MSNNNITWSVQIKTATFWKKLTIEEIRMEYEKSIEQLKKENKQLKKTLKSIKTQVTKSKEKSKYKSKNYK